MASHRVEDVRSEVKEGDQVLVKVVNIDPSGKIRLSRKALLESEGGPPAPAPGTVPEGGSGEGRPQGEYRPHRPEGRGERRDFGHSRGGGRDRDRRPR